MVRNLREACVRTHTLHRFAMERTTDFIKFWFWSRAADGIPSDVMNGASSIDTDNWVQFYLLAAALSI
jgi:hypothetical protein